MLPLSRASVCCYLNGAQEAQSLKSLLHPSLAIRSLEINIVKVCLIRKVVHGSPSIALCPQQGHNRVHITV